MFKQHTIDLGFVKSGRNYDVKFPYENIVNFEKIEMSCDCMTYLIEKKNSRLVVTYKPKKVPPHLKEINQTYYDTQKTITVFYTTKESATHQVAILTFNAKVID